MMKLSNKQKKFIDEYIIDLNATQAAIRAGYSKKTAKLPEYENLTKPNILEKIHNQLKNHKEKANLTVDELINVLMIISFTNIIDFIELKNGEIKLKDPKDMDIDKMAAIQFLQTNDTKYGQVQKIKLFDKLKAMEILARYTEIIKELDDKEKVIKIEREILRDRNTADNKIP